MNKPSMLLKIEYELGEKKYVNSNFREALVYYEKSYSLARECHHEGYKAKSIEGIALCYKKIADKYYENGESNFYTSRDGGYKYYVLAKENYQLAIKFFKKAGGFFKKENCKEYFKQDFLKIYIERCKNNIEICNEQIEHCETKSELVK